MRRLWLLGPARVDQIHSAEEEPAENGSNIVPRFRSRRTVALLGYLAAEQRPVAREHLAALFWPDAAPAKGRANLSRELHNLAQILPCCWELNRQSVAFAPEAGSFVDLYQVLDLEAQERWREAAELLSGEFLEGLYLGENPEFESWLLGERERWRGRADTILERVIEGHIRRGRYAEGLDHARKLLQLCPWNEGVHRRIMRLLVWTGQPGAALRQFESCRLTLWEELGVEPAAETVALCEQIRAGTLDLPPQLPAFLTEERARNPYKRPLFVGRKVELAKLEAFLVAALAGKSQVIFIAGGPGRGKTTLLEAFAQRAMEAHPNLLVAGGKGNAYAGLGDPYLPFREMMAVLTGEVEGRWDAGTISRDHAQRLWAAYPLVIEALLDQGPHLVDVLVSGVTLLSRSLAAGQDGAPWLPRLRKLVGSMQTGAREVEQSHLFEQASNVLLSITSARPLLLILDDLQWADAASISLLFHLGRRLAEGNGRLLIAGAYRPEEVALDRAGKRHPLAQVLSEFKLTFGDVWVDLGQTGELEERRFVNALLDAEPNRLTDDFRVALFKRTGGHPLFTVELLRAMQERGDLRQDADGAWIPGQSLDWEVLPARVEAVIGERVDRLSRELRDILAVASVEGEMFTAQVVAEVQGASERGTLRRLSQELERRHRLVREQEEVETDQKRLSRYRFGHVLFQVYLYRKLSQGERRLLHGEIARALERLHDRQLDEMAVQLALHFRRAGEHDRAFHYSSRAAERAARLYENREAIGHYTRAIELAGRVSPDAVSMVELHRGRGRAFDMMGEFDQARRDYAAAHQIAQAAGEQRLEGQALLDLGKLWASRDYNRAREHFEAALELARRMDEPAFLGDCLNWMGNWCANNASFSESVAFHQEALTIFEDLGHRRELTNTLDLLGLANLLGGDLGSSARVYDRAIALSRELDDQPRIASGLTGRATTFSALAMLASLAGASPRNAKADIQEALQIATAISSASEEIWARWSLGLMSIVQGEFGLALEELRIGLETASKIKHREWVVGNLQALGMLFAELFAPEQALAQLENARALTEELGSPTWNHNVGGSLAGVYLILDDQKQAEASLKTVLTPQTSMDTLGKRYCWVRRAELALAQDQPALALDITERLIATAAGLSPDRVIPYLWKLKGEALASLGHRETARSHLVSALSNARLTGERFLIWRLHASLGRLYGTMGCQEAAEREFSAARTFIEQLAATVPDETLKDEFRQGAARVLNSPTGN